MTAAHRSKGVPAIARIVVVGSLNMDLVVQVPRWPGPGETVPGERFLQVPGGKGANQAAAAAALGGEVAMVGRVGRDAFGEALLANLRRFGVDVSGVAADAGAPTGVAVIGVEPDGENRIVVVPGANGRLRPEDLAAPACADLWGQAEVLLLQCEIPVETIVAAARLGRRHGLAVLLDPAPPVPLPEEIWSSVDACLPNQLEAGVLTGRPVGDLTSARLAAADLLARGLRWVAVKLGAQGVLLGEGSDFLHIAGLKVPAVDTTAAGDVFAGALAVGLTEGLAFAAAASFANRAAALSTTRPGAQSSIPRREEVDALLRPPAGPATSPDDFRNEVEA
ncbi:MAG: ribokinase [Bacillota bacterium]|nr:ribokinase [Bacillota bacterium]